MSETQRLHRLHYTMLFLNVNVKEELTLKRFKVREKTWSTFVFNIYKNTWTGHSVFSSAAGRGSQRD